MTLPRPADFEGILSLSRTDNDGRQSAVHTGYRAAHQLHDNECSTGIHEYLDNDQVQPGESGRVAVCLSTPDMYPACLWEGREVNILEGKKQVGTLKVTCIFKATLRTSHGEYLNRWQAPRLTEIGACLLNLFHGDEYQINQQALQRLHELHASPLVLRMDATLFKTVMNMPGFATANCVARMLTGYRLNYTRSLAAFKAASSDETFLGLFQGASRKKAQEEYTQVVTGLGSLMYALSGYGHLAQEEVLALLDTGDSFLISFAGAMMDAFPTIDDQHIAQLLDTMEEYGVHEWPYQPGIALAAALTKNPKGFDTVLSRFEYGNDNLQSGILRSFESLEMALPLQAQDMIVRRAQSYDSNRDDETYSTTVIALALCKDRQAEAIAILAPSLDSEAWFIRGNAAMSLGLLGIEDEALINRLGDMIFDTEGNDWSVRSATLGALTELGDKASSQVSKLLQLARDDEDDEYTNQMLADCFAALGDDSAAVIEALRKIVARQAYTSGRRAVIALGKLGKAASPAMDAIKAFIVSEDYHVDNADHAHAVIDACIAINGADNVDVNNCIRLLAKSVHADVAEVAYQYLSRKTQK
ncbi:MAG: HEAT repeat domain-containing protein [Burkholderiales bacterium]|nr:HEAT repeat domain-containing protein [Burkholderiales bacterium]